MSIAYKISKFNRIRKWKIFQKYFPNFNQTTLLDVGYTENEYNETDNYLKKHYPYPKNITALGIESHRKFSERYPEVKAVQYGGSFRLKTSNLIYAGQMRL